MTAPDLRYPPARIAELMGIDFLPEQLAAIAAPPAPAVIVAGAGSGKTAVMAARVVYLVANRMVSPAQVLGLTFTNLAAGELQQRVRDALAKVGDAELLDADEPTVSTYHAFAASLVKSHGLWLGLEPDATVIADARRHQLAVRVLRQPRADVLALERAFDSTLQAMLDLDDRLADFDVTTDQLRAFDTEFERKLAALSNPGSQLQTILKAARGRQIVADLVDEFRAAKRQGEFIDYADMTRYALALAREVPTVAGGLREQFRVVLLDEYQDTSVAQRNLMRSLFGEGHPVTAVGDPLQCIYTWRGASPSNIDSFRQHFPNADGSPARVYDLPVTQRSGGNIVAVANHLSTSLRDFHLDIKPMQPPTKPRHGDGRIRLGVFETAAAEADWLANHLRAAAATGVGYEDMALLLRTNADVTLLHGLLSERGIPVQVRSKWALLEVPEVAEVVAMLRVIAEPAANPAWVRLLTGPRWRIGDRDLAVIGARASRLAPTRASDAAGVAAALAAAVADVDLADLPAYGDAVEDIAEHGHAELSPAARQRLQVLAAEVRHLRAHTSEPLVELVQRVIRTTGLAIEAAATPDRVVRGMASNLRAFVGMASDFVSVEGGTTVFDFLDWIDAGVTYKAEPKLDLAVHPGAVQLMTVHAAKGLQYRVVGLPRLREGVFPSTVSPAYWPNLVDEVPGPLRDERQTAEFRAYPDVVNGPNANAETAFKQEVRRLAMLDERRLVYVAVTRTTDLLLVSTSAVTNPNSAAKAPSRFIEEIREVAAGLAGDVQVELTPVAAPASGESSEPAWPVAFESESVRRTRELAVQVRQLLGTTPAASADPQVRRWDEAIAAIEREAAAKSEPVLVPLPDAVSVSGLQQLARDPAGFLADLIRPMPRKPSRAAGLGIAFHAWVEQQARDLAGPGVQERLPLGDDYDFAEPEVLEPAELARFRENFAASEWADRAPFDVEVPIAVRFAGRTVHGRIDAVFRDQVDGRDRWTILDWKTNRAADADALQLALYARAWCEMHGLEPASVRAGFFYAALGRTDWPQLPDLAEFEARLLNGESSRPA